MIMNPEQIRIWNKDVMAYLMILS